MGRGRRRMTAAGVTVAVGDHPAGGGGGLLRDTA